jgi:hypothetical protein
VDILSTVTVGPDCPRRVDVRDTARNPPRDDIPEETVAKPVPEDRRDPAWPQLPDGEHPVTELTTDVQGNLSPFGEIEFPLDDVPYTHPHTEVNR